MTIAERESRKPLAIWAAECAERVLPLFEAARRNDPRPRDAILACREWAQSGVFSMKAVRRASLDAHAAARAVAPDSPACFAARAAGQAVATAHVREHAFGPALYALKAAGARDPHDAQAAMIAELRWQRDRLPLSLRAEWSRFQLRRLPKKLRLVWGAFVRSG